MEVINIEKFARSVYIDSMEAVPKSLRSRKQADRQGDNIVIFEKCACMRRLTSKHTNVI